MSSKKILVVFGATGNQGGSVIQSILKDPILSVQFHIRGITRDPSKPSAAALAKQGVSLVKADLDDITSLRAAMIDAHAVYAVTNWQEVLNQEREVQQGKNIADIANKLNVKHLVWSSLPHVSRITSGAITGALHFDSKGLVEEHIRSLSIPATYLHLGVFMAYPLFQLFPSPSSPGQGKAYTMQSPLASTVKYPLISANSDVGKYVVGILLSPDRVLGKQVIAVEGFYTLDEIVEILREKGGLDVIYQRVTDVEYRKSLGARGFPEFLQEDMSQNMRFVEGWGMFGGQEGEVEEGKKLLKEPLETYEQWVEKSEEVKALK